MTSVRQPDSTADSVLSHAAKAIEIQDLEARVAELERARADNSADEDHREADWQA